MYNSLANFYFRLRDAHPGRSCERAFALLSRVRSERITYLDYTARRTRAFRRFLAVVRTADSACVTVLRACCIRISDCKSVFYFIRLDHLCVCAFALSLIKRFVPLIHVRVSIYILLLSSPLSSPICAVSPAGVFVGASSQFSERSLKHAVFPLVPLVIKKTGGDR